MKIDWGRVPEKTLVEFHDNVNNCCIEYFWSYNKENNSIRATRWLRNERGSDMRAECYDLVMPEDIEKYAIKEEPKYVCPVCGEEVKQQEDYRDVRQIFTLGKYDVKEITYQFHICENPKCGIVMAGRNGHFGKKVVGC